MLLRRPYDYKADCFSVGVIAYILCVLGLCPSAPVAPLPAHAPLTEKLSHGFLRVTEAVRLPAVLFGDG